MFVVVAVRQSLQGAGLGMRFVRFLLRRKVWRQTGSLRGTSYLLLTVADAAHPPVKKLQALAGREAARIVAGSEIILPAKCGLTRWHPKQWGARLTVTAALQLLELLPREKRQLVGVIDECGLYPWCCQMLLKRCDAIRVFSHRPRLYEQEARRLMEEEGAPVLFTDEPLALSGCSFCLLLDGGESLKLPAPVITAAENDAPGTPTISFLQPATWWGEQDAIPPGANPNLLLAAAEELAPGRSVQRAELYLSDCRIDGRQAAFEQILEFYK